MKKPSFDVKRRPYTNNKHSNNNYRAHNNVKPIESFSLDKLKQFDEEVIEIFKLIQAVRYDKINLQEQYNESRQKLNNDRINLEAEIIKIKKEYNTRISALQEEYNSVKSNSTIELAKLRQG